MKLVTHPCPHRVKPGEAQRSPRRVSFGLVAYVARCPDCEWPNMVNDAKETEGRVSFSVNCAKCSAVLEVKDVEIPIVEGGCGTRA